MNETDKVSALELFKQADASDNIENILKELIRIPTVYDKLWQNILIHLSTEIDLICGLRNPSVLRSKLAEINPETFLKEILMEMHQRCPKVLQFLMTIVIPLHIAMPERSHVIAAMYALAMYQRNSQLIAFQKAVAAACLRYNAGNGVIKLNCIVLYFVCGIYKTMIKTIQ